MANLRFRVLPRFPARLFADGGIGVDKDGADWTISPDWGTLSVLSSITDPVNSEVWVRVTSAGVSTYFRMTLQALLTSVASTGAGYAFVWNYSTDTTDADPGAGIIRFNQAVQNTATQFFTDLLDSAGNDLTALLDSLDDSTNTVKGNWSLVKVGDQTKRLAGTLTAVTSVAGYRKLTIAVTFSTSASPFANGEALLFTFARAGDASTVPNPIVLTEGAAPGTPSSGTVAVYANADGRSYEKDDLGRERRLSGEGLTPQGRLTLTANTPIMTVDTSAQTTIRYTPYWGRFVPLFDGTAYSMVDTGGELTQTTTDTTKSPAAVANNSNYDLFVWDDAGTMRCTRGPLWTSDTARGTGAGTTELTRIQGFLLNAVSITNGPAAQRGTYVGSVRSNGSAQIDWLLGATAANGTAAVLGVWNAYHRVSVSAQVADTVDSHTYALLAFRSWNAQTTMRISFISGLAEDSAVITGMGFVNSGAGQNAGVGIGVNSTSTPTGLRAPGTATAATPTTAFLAGAPLLGFNFYQLLESSGGTNTSTFFGDNGGDGALSGIASQLRM